MANIIVGAVQLGIALLLGGGFVRIRTQRSTK